MSFFSKTRLLQAQQQKERDELEAKALEIKRAMKIQKILAAKEMIISSDTSFYSDENTVSSMHYDASNNVVEEFEFTNSNDLDDCCSALKQESQEFEICMSDILGYDYFTTGFKEVEILQKLNADVELHFNNKLSFDVTKSVAEHDLNQIKVELSTLTEQKRVLKKEISDSIELTEYLENIDKKDKKVVLLRRHKPAEVIPSDINHNELRVKALKAQLKFIDKRNSNYSEIQRLKSIVVNNSNQLVKINKLIIDKWKFTKLISEDLESQKYELKQDEDIQYKVVLVCERFFNKYYRKFIFQQSEMMINQFGFDEADDIILSPEKNKVRQLMYQSLINNQLGLINNRIIFVEDVNFVPLHIMNKAKVLILYDEHDFTKFSDLDRKIDRYLIPKEYFVAFSMMYFKTH